MVFIPQSDFFFNVSKGLVPGHSPVFITGENDDLGTTKEDIWNSSGQKSFISSAETMNIVSTSINDTSAGTGTRTVLIEGLNNSHVEINETVIMNGTTNVLTSNSYLRVYRITSVTAGSLESNVGDITATASTAATLQESMKAASGISRSAHYTVPVGKTFYIAQAIFNTAKLSSGSDPKIIIVVERRDGNISNPSWVTLFEREFLASANNIVDIRPIVQRLHTEKTDIRVVSISDKANTIVRSYFSGVLVNN